MSSSASHRRFLTLFRSHAPTAACGRINRYHEESVVSYRSKRAWDRIRVAKFSSITDNTASVSECARHLSQLSQRNLASALAQHLSPSARREITEARKLVMSKDEMAKADFADQNKSGETVAEPSPRDLRLVALNQSIPFVGFGIMDNAILILAGDAIDASLGVMLGISTLCAAAIGNIISDLAGVGLGTAIEDWTSKLNLPQPNINQMQRTLRSVRFASQFGCAAGITIGCIIGMFPLYFIDTKKVEKMKQEAHMDSIFNDMVTEANKLIGAEHTCLYTVVENDEDTLPLPFSDRTEIGRGKYLYGRYVDDSRDGTARHTHTHVPLGRGILSRSALTGTTVNIFDVKTESDFDYDTDIIFPVPLKNVKNMVCVPVFDTHGDVIAIIQALNKISKGSVSPSRSDDRLGRGFTSHDIQVLRALATHVSVSLENMREEDRKMSLRDTICVLKRHRSSVPDKDLQSSS